MSCRRIGATIGFVLVLAWPPARAADGMSDIDDPKVARRLGTRIDWPGPVVVRPPAVPSPSPPADTGAPVAPLAPAGPGAPEAFVEGTAAPSPGAAPPSTFVAPRAKLALRHFSFFQLGASSSRDGVADTEAFDSVAVDVYPISSLVRIGLSTQFGWQSENGMFSTRGDYFAAESLSLGVQRLGNRIVPFAEAFGGVGYMRRLQFDRSMPTAYFQFGVDVGAEIYFGRVGFVSLALGYLRPINGFAAQQTFVTAFVDSWSLKLGVGL